MKQVSLLAFTTLASSFILPQAEFFRDEPVDDSSGGAFLLSLERESASAQPVLNQAEADFHAQFGASRFEDDEDVAPLADHPGHGPPRHGHPRSNLTIYQFISQNNYTTKFAKLVDQHDSVVKLLNSTDANYTLFVPIDSAFEHIPPHHKDPSKELIEAFLRYHIAPGLFPFHHLLTRTKTLPTALDAPALDGRPQRLRVGLGLHPPGPQVNFFSRIVGGEPALANGIVYGVHRIVVPPLPARALFDLVPSQFSTLLLAYQRTDFDAVLSKAGIVRGSTIFAPTNGAFAALGPRANAFLFATEKGKKYLAALLKYQVVANETLYSDAFYGDDSSSSELPRRKRFHVDLPTLLDDKAVSVDVARFGAFVRVVVNGGVGVVVPDVVARDGVVQVVGRVPIPPHKHHRGREESLEGEISVEELKERLADYVEEDRQEEGLQGVDEGHFEDL
ncbi:hypothetical protein VTK73DRAFT_8008 [Phialemonium thermophilum]|uniref:FAS1 domain-containing protein n=1 Tax=Phialemonium thermophilum TaxID=223376 RepID=A0ABR3XR89_9PEZI